MSVKEVNSAYLQAIVDQGDLGKNSAVEMLRTWRLVDEITVTSNLVPRLHETITANGGTGFIHTGSLKNYRGIYSELNRFVVTFGKNNQLFPGFSIDHHTGGDHAPATLSLMLGLNPAIEAELRSESPVVEEENEDLIDLSEADNENKTKPYWWQPDYPYGVTDLTVLGDIGGPPILISRSEFVNPFDQGEKFGKPIEFFVDEDVQQIALNHQQQIEDFIDAISSRLHNV